MEIMSAAYQTGPPQTQPTRDSRPTAPAVGREPQHFSAPASQESILSIYSNGSSVTRSLQDNSSNASQLTNVTELTSSPPLTASGDRHHGLDGRDAAPVHRRACTPEQRISTVFPLASPMSITSPATTNGTKRTASGHVKNASSIPCTPLAASFSPRKPRTESMSSAGSRAGELAANLKMRLGYAMAKVQNGWEHKTISELEQMASQKVSPNRHSMSHYESVKRPVSGSLNHSTARLTHDLHSVPASGPVSPPSKRHSGAYSSYAAMSHPAAASFAGAPRLQPPADIRPNNGTWPAESASMGRSTVQTNGMSPPRTPVHHYHSRRPPTIRTDTQTAEAERDALQALTQLGSPQNSQISRHHNTSQGNSSQASPLRTEFMPARRVNFARGDSDSSAMESSSDDSVLESRARAVNVA